ncbi:MAG: MAPEG family protein [Pseudolabrys sp.]|nr:MAPEG family protein [Pseudolabrys sp.]MBV9956584.1 MAPEG family protein [Pseudolabrys sp.]
MTLTIVPVYGAILGLIFVVLGIRVAMMRRDHRISVGHGDKKELELRIRVHGNFAEYVPMALILFTFVELQTRPAYTLHLLCGALLLGRILHIAGLGYSKLILRFIGMNLTFGAIAAAGIIILWGVIFGIPA